MSRPKNHISDLHNTLANYAWDRALDFHRYSPYHFRIMDGGFVVVDVWTTGRYFVVMTDYTELTDDNVIERSGEKGNLPVDNIKRFLDILFFPQEANK